MVDVSSQSNKVNITVSSSGVSSNVSASGDTSHYYSEKAREWATSNRIVDGVDYSSKYYAEKSNQSALNAQSFAQSAQDSYNNFQQSVDGALSTVNDTVQIAITTIDTKSGEAIDSINSTKTDIITDIEFVADGEKQEINELADVIKDNANTVNTAIEAGVERLNSIDSLKNNQITNCLLEVPQRIKLELNNGILTLKAGSEVIVPNGFEEDGTTPKFDYVTIESDIDVGTYGTTPAYDNIMIFLKTDGTKATYFKAVQSILSGTTPVAYSLYYKTDLNKVYDYEADTTTPFEQNSFPIGIFSWDGTKVTSIKQIFSGMGYIGSTVWVDKGVKALHANGRNEDGTLRNIEVTTPSVTLTTIDSNWIEQDWFINIDGTIGWYPMVTGGLRFNEETNYWEDSRVNYQSYHCPFAVTQSVGGKITNFQPKLPFRAVDYSDYVNTPHIVETYRNGYSWYRIYSDGWCEQGGTAVSGPTANITFLKPFLKNDYCLLMTGKGMAGSDHVSFGTSNVTVSGATLSWDGNNTDPAGIFWEAKGYIA